MFFESDSKDYSRVKKIENDHKYQPYHRRQDLKKMETYQLFNKYGLGIRDIPIRYNDEKYKDIDRSLLIPIVHDGCSGKGTDWKDLFCEKSKCNKALRNAVKRKINNYLASNNFDDSFVMPHIKQKNALTYYDCGSALHHKII
jgi:hypothetical protein